MLAVKLLATARSAAAELSCELPSDGLADDDVVADLAAPDLLAAAGLSAEFAPLASAAELDLLVELVVLAVDDCFPTAGEFLLAEEAAVLGERTCAADPVLLAGGEGLDPASSSEKVSELGFVELEDFVPVDEI